MELREIMTTNVECIPPDSTLADAAIKMKTLDIGFLPVCDNDRLIGTLTDRDIVIRGLAGGRDANASAKSVMSKDVFFCYEDDDIEHCADHMKEKAVKRMLVLNRDKRLVGVVSLGDLSKAQKSVAADALQDISEAA
jgi:CBS domain-containing protein